MNIANLKLPKEVAEELLLARTIARADSQHVHNKSNTYCERLRMAQALLILSGAEVFTSGEVATLERALRMYAAKYQEMAGREMNPGLKKDLLEYITRADELIVRLRPELQHRSAGGSSTLLERSNT